MHCRILPWTKNLACCRPKQQQKQRIYFQPWPLYESEESRQQYLKEDSNAFQRSQRLWSLFLQLHPPKLVDLLCMSWTFEYVVCSSPFLACDGGEQAWGNDGGWCAGRGPSECWTRQRRCVCNEIFTFCSWQWANVLGGHVLWVNDGGGQMIDSMD